MRSSNPILDSNAFNIKGKVAYDGGMTISGTVNKSLMLLALVSAGVIFSYLNSKLISLTYIYVWAIGGFVVGLVTRFKPEWSQITTPIYAIFQGLALGALSLIVDLRFPGIAIQATLLTFGVLFSLLAAYKSGLIKATEKLKKVIYLSIISIAVVYLIDLIFGIPFINESSGFGILFSLVVVVIASLKLILDFDFIEQSAKYGSPKYMEWYAAFGLLVTLIWLYVEILILLMKLTDRRNQ